LTVSIPDRKYEEVSDDSVMAVFSDVHSNLEALQAVLAEMELLGLERRVCLGDIVGYGADPAECLELVRSLNCPVIQGNHDQLVAGNGQLEGISETAKSGMEFARERLSIEQRAYLANLPMTLIDQGCEFVHASLDQPEGWWYVLRPEDALLHFEAQTQPVCFCGHTHVPFVWHSDPSGKLDVAQGTGAVRLPPTGKALINVGSVGQPRDRRAEACYAIYDLAAKRVEFRRVPYNVAKAKRKILKANLPRFAAQRLSQGK